MSCTQDLRAFGYDLFIWFQKEEPEFAGWWSSKCDVVAIALQKWIGPEAEVWVHSQEGAPGEWDHALVKVGDCFLDVQGAWTEREVNKTWRTYPEPILRPAEEEDEVGPSCSIRTVNRLVKRLEKAFGPGARVLKWARSTRKD
jgi:hypothetical protein